MENAFQWNEKYATQVAAIDSQHQKLFAILNELYSVIKDHGSQDELARIASKLEDYTRYHFTFEEKYLEMFKFPKLKEHRQHHQTFIDKIASFKKAVDENTLDTPLKMLDFLIDWLVDHILIKDQRYVGLFKKNIDKIES